MESAKSRKLKQPGNRRNKKTKPTFDNSADLLYSRKNIVEMMEMAHTIEFDRKYRFNDELEIEFKVAGHILGAASAILYITDDDKTSKVGFTGDLGNYNSKLVPDPNPMSAVDYLITESTYGGREHITDAESAGEVLLKHVIETCVNKGGKLVIPAFSVGRTQAIIYTLHELYREGKLPNIKIFTDSPLAIRSTKVYQHSLEFLNEDAHQFQKKHSTLFDFPLLNVIEDEKESEILSVMPEPCVIISAAGMVEGGRIQMHIRNNIGHPENTVLIAGFCAEGTLGHRLLQGQDFVEINFKKRPVHADIYRTDAFSAHPDHNGLLKYIKASTTADTKGIFLVHGDAGQMQILAADIKTNPVFIPEKGKEYHLEM